MPPSAVAASAPYSVPVAVVAEGPMEQSRTSPDAGRERAISSEPCATRPNPFDESDLSARKRRRTSLSASSGISGDFPLPRDHDVHATHGTQITATSTAAMKVDLQETAVPSTPPASSDHRPEPVSSRVTINLRNGPNHDAPHCSPASPSPTEARASRPSGANNGQPFAVERGIREPLTTPTSVIGSPEHPVVIVDDDDDDENDKVVVMVDLTDSARPSSPDLADQLLTSLANFPYVSGPEDTCYDSFGRLHQYLSQGTQDPDDVLRSLISWLDIVLRCATPETLEVFSSACSQNQDFWLGLPELFLVIWRRYNACRSDETFGLVQDVMQSYAKLTAYVLAADCHMLGRIGITKTPEDCELYSANFLWRLVAVAHRDEHQTLEDHIADTWPVLAAFGIDAHAGSGLALITQFAGLLPTILPKFPKRAMDHLAKASALEEALVYNYQKRLVNESVDAGIVASPQTVVVTALEFFSIAWDMMLQAIDKLASQVPHNIPTALLASLCGVYRTVLSCSVPEIEAILQAYMEEHPEMPPNFLPDAITLEKRFSVLERLIRSQQMQLRVSAVSGMCDELIGQWKRYQGQIRPGGEDEAHFAFLRHFASHLLQTGIIDYFLSPSCHPEITVESSNIIGFLMVTKTFTHDQCELLWTTITTSRDPRITEALVRMLLKITQLFDASTICILFEKLGSVTMEELNPTMRELFSTLLQQVCKLTDEAMLVAPRQLCLRLIQEASVFAPHDTLVNPDIFSWAYSKMKEILIHGCPASGRHELFLSCQQDISSGSPTTHGSLQVLHLLTITGTSLQSLIVEHDFVRLVVDELECAISNARAVGFSPVYATPLGPARRKLISGIVLAHGSAISKSEGRKLWDHLVGANAICLDDMKAGWDDLNNAFKRTRQQNEFLVACLQDYLPELPPRCFCAGSLEFVRENLLVELSDPNTTIFDEESTVDCKALELLWQMILKSPPQTIEDQAIHTLVSEIYINSATINALPLDRAREVHFSLAKRCMRQLKAAAQAFQDCERDTEGGGGAKHDRPELIQQYELQFTRSLRVVKDLLHVLKGQVHFSAPDLRPLMLQTPSAVDGELADLKYQAFDGEGQSSIVPFKIGLRNTGASLLASLREATGFQNYRLYYRGQPLAPTSDDICKSIQELEITTGLILVRRNSNASETPDNIRPGASPLEIEVLGYFKELWEYLSLEEHLSSEIYQFLIKLPADESILATVEAATTFHRDVFPIGQPFKSLYAVHALREHLDTHRVRNNVVQSSSHDLDCLDESASNHRRASVKVLTLLVSALCDEDVIGQDMSEDIQTLLRSQLVDTYVQIVKESVDGLLETALISAGFCNMLMRIFEDAMLATQNSANSELIKRIFQAILVSSERSSEFWDAFRTHSRTTEVLQKAILTDGRKSVRRGIANLIANHSLGKENSETMKGAPFAGFFWSIVFDTLPDAALVPLSSDEVFHLAIQLITKLAEVESEALDLTSCLERCAGLLMEHAATEDITQPDTCDSISHGLAVLLSLAVKFSRTKGVPLSLGRDFSRRLLRHHLFPSTSADFSLLVPRVITNPDTRGALYDILFMLSKDSSSARLLKDLDGLTPYEEGSTSPYSFELPQSFDRQRTVRSSCGYAGLRNLSNTCYYNSLMTQLFMNIEFRGFMLSIDLLDPTHQQLISETRKLFAALQGSLRRFVDPQSCVAQISTYEETPIDIHNQMDVDEFYNLLFDRWEAQLPSEIDKKRLRSIFGGELVQQVKSKECDHISERFEDFSAIQCDIKGKATLEESLQAYVDGEIMQGDNKYKCSSCDRFVDAVKRACFKTLPNNLIFHLKRFDFNLRTMTRAKIYDHFRFPTSIDMKPYTVQHLANLPDAPASDMFELVGVLVHSGSAESGHYYSYVRERASTGPTGKWVEFNDDAVTAWDPSSMADACFGGHDQRQPFDGGPHDKVYSAYMLFYQRSQTSESGDADLNGSGETSPLNVALPPDLATDILDENIHIVHRHCLHDPNHTPFVIRMLNSVWGSECSSANHTVENLAMQVGLNHLDQVASRAKDLPDFPDLLMLLQQACQRCAHCCLAFWDYLWRRPEAMMMLLQKNPHATVRHEIGRTLIAVLRNLRKNFPEAYGTVPLEYEEVEEPENIISRTVDLFSRLWEQFHVSLRSWPEYFGVMLDFARMGRLEAAALIHGNILLQTAAIITVEATAENNAQYSRLATTLSRRMASRPPSYDNIISLIDALLGVMDEEIVSERIVESDENRLFMAYEEETIPFSSLEVNLIHENWARGHGNIFVDKLIQINQNIKATDSIIKRLINLNDMMDDAVYTTLRGAITGSFVQHSVTPYLRVAAIYCRFSQNIDNIARLRAYINGQCLDVQNAEARSFFEFQRHMYASAEDLDEQCKSLVDFQKWAPGLLGHVDQTVSRDVYKFIHDALLRFGPNLSLSEAVGGVQRSKAIATAARRLCLRCLVYLRDTYVDRGVPVAKETVTCLLQTIRSCGAYFSTEDSSGDVVDVQYHELCRTVLEPMNTLAVDDIDEDSEWENSVDSSDHMDSLEDLSMQVTSDAPGGD